MKLKQKQKQHTSSNTTSERVSCFKLSSLVVCPKTQQMFVYNADKIIKTYPISTAKNGLGEEINSFKTPRGLHKIRAKIGANAPLNAIFVGRRFKGEIYTPKLNEQYPDRDWILTRILWLCGMEPGFNRYGSVDTMKRYVYIHGSPIERPTGTPTSKGCVRMRNEDIMELFDNVAAGTEVLIKHN